MDGPARRVAIIEALKKVNKPLSGVVLGNQFGISRQIVVQDVALLRAEGYDILATARGYILNQEADIMHSRILMVKHTKNQLEDELNTIVDNGGRVRNVIITHPIYGELIGDLMLKNRRDVKSFIERVECEKVEPLSKLTEGIHMHTIEATTDEDLDHIEEELKLKGYLV